MIRKEVKYVDEKTGIGLTVSKSGRFTFWNSKSNNSHSFTFIDSHKNVVDDVLLTLLKLVKYYEYDKER